ncbi:MAG: hypothetical protein IKT41_03280 [Clostridia bacterium]|nr:hypothetical protein [Clostridia bacterium]
MAKIGEIKTVFEGVEGFHFRENQYEQLTDVTLPKTFDIISKRVNHGLLKKIEFKDDKGKHYLFE